MPDASESLFWPMSFEARYGDGLDRTICLGGGGLYFVAWQVAYLNTAIQGGLDVKLAERVVGTSAGSVVATSLAGGRIGRLRGQVAALSKFPPLLRAMAPAGSLRPSQLRALTEFGDAVEATPDTITSIGHAALAAVTPDAVRMRANLQVILQTTSWPSPVLHITAVDAYTGERCVITESSKIRPSRAAAASSAVPGLFPPQPIHDRKCMDGGVSGTGLHLDLVSGAGRTLILALRNGQHPNAAGMTESQGTTETEQALLEASGTRTFLRTPAAIEREKLMSPEEVPQALADGARQAEDDLPALLEFWA